MLRVGTLVRTAFILMLLLTYAQRFSAAQTDDVKRQLLGEGRCRR